MHTCYNLNHTISKISYLFQRMNQIVGIHFQLFDLGNFLCRWLLQDHRQRAAAAAAALRLDPSDKGRSNKGRSGGRQGGHTQYVTRELHRLCELAFKNHNVRL